MLATTHTLTKKLALLKGCGWSIASLACLGYYYALAQEQLPAALWVTILAGGAAAIAGFIYSKTPSANSDRDNFIFLLSDILFLSAAIHFTGAITNPFTSSLLVPVALGIALLPKKYTLTNLVIACSIYLFWLLSADHHNMMHHNFSLHLYGMGINFILSAVLLLVFISHALATVKKHQQELNSAREKMINDEQLIGIASLTANTAHALGTPLQTLTIITDDLAPNTPVDTEDLTLIKQQVSTCKRYLRQLTHTAELAKNTALSDLSIAQLTDKLEHHYSLQPHQKELAIKISDGHSNNVLTYSESLFFAIINLIDNALKAASQKVGIDFIVTEKSIAIRIHDDGAGIPESVTASIGKPFVKSDGNGLGLGYYLSHYTIEKCQGELRVSSGNTQGTLTEIVLPRADR